MNTIMMLSTWLYLFIVGYAVAYLSDKESL